MFDYDAEELRTDLKPFVGTLDPHHNAVFAAHDVTPPSLMAIADHAGAAIRAMSLFASVLGIAQGLTASLNRESLDGDQKEAASKVIDEMNELKKKFSHWSASDDPEFQFVRGAAERSGYTLSDWETDALDFMGKWSEPFRQTIGHVLVIRQQDEGTFLGALLQSGVGEVITPYALLMREAIRYPAVVDANARLLEHIEADAHSYMLANAVTHSLINSFATLLGRAEDKRLNLYTSFRPDSEEALIDAAISADIGDSLLPGRSDTSRFQHNIVAGAGQTKVDALKDALLQVIEKSKSPNYKLSAIMVLDDDGKALSLKEYFEKIGEEVPQDVLDELNRDQ